MRLKLSFFEREFFADNRAGTHVKGYEPAIIMDHGVLKRGHIIDTERLATAESIDTKLAEMEVSVNQHPTDLTEHLEATEGGKKWLGAHRRLHYDEYNCTVPITITAEPLEIKPMRCTIFPPDYFERVERNRYYQPPQATIEKLAQEAVYARVLPPLKFATGKWIQGFAYKRLVRLANNEHWEYALEDATSREFTPMPGIILGEINETGVTNKSEEFKGVLSANGFLEVVYLVSIRDKQHNPLWIHVNLAEK